MNLQGGKVKAHQNSHLRHIMLTVVNEVQTPLQSQIPSIHATSERQQSSTASGIKRAAST
jgi:hypothetical protein